MATCNIMLTFEIWKFRSQIPGDATHEELWKFFSTRVPPNRRMSTGQLESDSPGTVKEPHLDEGEIPGVESIHLIGRYAPPSSSCKVRYRASILISFIS